MKKSVVALLLVVLVSASLLSACGTAEKPIEVKDVVIAKGLGSGMEAVNPTLTFLPTEPIAVSIVLAGRPKKGIVDAKFFYGDQLIIELSADVSSLNSGVLVSVGEDTYVGFTVTHENPFPVNNTYYVQVFINGKEYGKYPFAVVAQ